MKHAEKTCLRLVANTRAVAVRRSGIASSKAAMVARRAPTRGFTKGRTHDGDPLAGAVCLAQRPPSSMQASSRTKISSVDNCLISWPKRGRSAMVGEPKLTVCGAVEGSLGEIFDGRCG